MGSHGLLVGHRVAKEKVSTGLGKALSTFLGASTNGELVKTICEAKEKRREWSVSAAKKASPSNQEASGFRIPHHG